MTTYDQWKTRNRDDEQLGNTHDEEEETMTELILEGGAAKYTRVQIVRELKREIEMRRRVYGRMVETGAMKQKDHDYRIGILEQIVTDYLGAG
jgi:ATP-dependent Lon protease